MCPVHSDTSRGPSRPVPRGGSGRGDEQPPGSPAGGRGAQSEARRCLSGPSSPVGHLEPRPSVV
eukprot:4330525-Pyramimonas_sp.AAC.1